MNPHHADRRAAAGHVLPRRRFLQSTAGAAAMLAWPLGANAVVKESHLALPLSSSRVATRFELTLARTQVNFTGTPASAITLNGTVPGPLLRMQLSERISGREAALAEALHREASACRAFWRQGAL